MVDVIICITGVTSVLSYLICEYLLKDSSSAKRIKSGLTRKAAKIAEFHLGVRATTVCSWLREDLLTSHHRVFYTQTRALQVREAGTLKFEFVCPLEALAQIYFFMVHKRTRAMLKTSTLDHFLLGLTTHPDYREKYDENYAWHRDKLQSHHTNVPSLPIYTYTYAVANVLEGCSSCCFGVSSGAGSVREAQKCLANFGLETVVVAQFDLDHKELLKDYELVAGAVTLNVLNVGDGMGTPQQPPQGVFR